MGNPCFEIGLVMAGAISAGAYTAGVMDFIMEALDAYEAAKTQPDWDGPTHDVRIPVMAGASAGGMTATISALHVFRGLEHVWPGKAPPAPARNRLYSSWVEQIDIMPLLAISDLDGDKAKDGVKSLLCCDIIDAIVTNAFNIQGPVNTPNWIGRGNDKTLRVFLTLTNLRGVPYSFQLFGADDDERYGMLNHGDYLDFTIGQKPSSAAPGSHPLDIDNTEAGEWDLLRTAAKATGAFPVGLAPRIIQRNVGDYNSAERVGFELPGGGFQTVRPDGSIIKADPYAFVAVDGGTIDNDPLELARRFLSGGAARRNEQSGEAANKAVVLIAPFPNDQTTPSFDNGETLLNIVPRLFSALVDQARFKPDELAKAADETIYSRYMIAPTRDVGDNDVARRYPIACGVLGGFGGFLDQSFRRHDYLLGRRNAQAFLRWNFALPVDNRLFKDAKIDARWIVPDPRAADGGPKKFATQDRTEGGPGLPIIPLTKALATEITISRPEDLPRKIEFENQPTLQHAIRTRAQRVVATLVDVDLQGVTTGLFGGIERYFATKLATDFAVAKANVAISDAFKNVNDAFD
jgi:hypothetical protein